MDDLDRKIEAALSAEDRAILAKFGEQGVFSQWFGVYDGAVRGMAVFATIVTFALFVAAVIAAGDSSSRARRSTSRAGARAQCS